MGQKQNMQNNSLVNSKINPIPKQLASDMPVEGMSPVWKKWWIWMIILVIIACSTLAYFILF